MLVTERRAACHRCADILALEARIRKAEEAEKQAREQLVSGLRRAEVLGRDADLPSLEHVAVDEILPREGFRVHSARWFLLS